jgi:hypothetical protein
VSWASVTILSGLIVIIVLLVATPEKLEIENPLTFNYRGTETIESGDSKTPSGFEGAVAEEREINLQKDEKSEVVIDPSEISFETEKEDEAVVNVEVLSVSATLEPGLEDTTSAIAGETVPRPASAYPDILGKLTVDNGGVVWFMIQDIYGACDRKRLALVKRANPHIGNLSIVFAGDIITFPSIPAETISFDSDRCLVQIAEKENLQDAYDFLKDSRGKNLPPMQLIPHWNSYGGLKFSLILREEFDDEESALETLNRLPVAVSSGAKIIEQWEEGTVIFSYDVL